MLGTTLCGRGGPVDKKAEAFTSFGWHQGLFGSCSLLRLAAELTRE